jgi:hypothetical protein
VYIDDGILLSHSSAKADSAIRQYLPVAESNGTPAKPSKVLYATSDPTRALGLEVDGVQHTVGLSVPKLQQLCHDTLSMLDRGQCTGRDMEVLVGRWTWACLVRRPSLSVFSSVYRFQEAAQGKRFFIWPSVRRELMVMVGLAPLLFADLDNLFFTRVVASDASSLGMGVVATSPMPPSSVESFVRSLPSRPPLTDADVSRDRWPAPTDVISDAWHTIVSSPWRRQEHINVLELRAVSTAIRWVLSFPASLRSRLLLLTDSTVCFYSLLKGRSSAPPLLRCLRSLSALLLASGMTLVPRWIPSELNPADAPSRDF